MDIDRNANSKQLHPQKGSPPKRLLKLINDIPKSYTKSNFEELEDVAFEVVSELNQLRGAYKELKEDKLKLEKRNTKLVEEKKNLELSKDILCSELNSLRTLQKLRKKIESLEEAFLKTSNTEHIQMERTVWSHLNSMKNDYLKQVLEQLKKLRVRDKQLIITTFSKDKIRDMAASIMQNLKEKAEKDLFLANPTLAEDVKESIVKILLEPDIDPAINVSDPYPIHLDHRFTKWMYFMLKCPDPRITTLHALIIAKNLDICSFCLSVTELYTMTFGTFHPASTILIYREKLKLAEMLETLKNNFDLEEETKLRSFEILFTLDVLDP